MCGMAGCLDRQRAFRRRRTPLPQAARRCPLGDNHHGLNAILQVAENGCKWRALPECGKLPATYMRMRRQARKGALQKILDELKRKRILPEQLEVLLLDSASIKAHPDGTGTEKKNGPQAIGRSLRGPATKVRSIAVDANAAAAFSLAPGQSHDAPAGRVLIGRLGSRNPPDARSWTGHAKTTGR